MIRAFSILSIVLLPVICARAQATIHPQAQRPRLPLILDTPHFAGLSETVLRSLLDTSETATFHRTGVFDVTYSIDGLGMLTIYYFDGKAGRFRLILSRPRSDPEDLPLMLGIDTSPLHMRESIDVKRVWDGRYANAGQTRVVVVAGAHGWQMAEVTVGSHSPR